MWKNTVLYTRTGYRWKYGACALHAGWLRLQTHNQNMSYLLLFHFNNCYTNTLQCYAIHALLPLFDLVALSKYTLCPKSHILNLKVHHMITKAARNRKSSENYSLTQICLCTVNLIAPSWTQSAKKKKTTLGVIMWRIHLPSVRAC